MKFFLNVLFILCASSAHADDFIDDGTPVSENSFSAVVKIGSYRLRKQKETLTQTCSGTLIAPDVVLTAAHCVRDNEVQRVSSYNDRDGKINQDKGGVKVIRSFRLGSFPQYFAKCTEAIEFLTGSLRRLSDLEKRALFDKTRTICYDQQSVDVAFLQLEQPQNFKSGQVPTLGCGFSLSPGAAVTLAGFGKNFRSDGSPQVNSNSLERLQSGKNILSQTPLPGYLYVTQRRSGMQIVNHGDSGGPLFAKGNTSVVYGVASFGENNEDGQATVAYFTNLSSSRAHRVYDEILLSKELPNSLKKILKKCSN